ncbi:hypothetical protein C8Q75DRAFT_261151 [Abortiporus biennis]|nr:hypothetical protein C8Q75DRAFT_261151 [Abortiporus biennis]
MSSDSSLKFDSSISISNNNHMHETTVGSTIPKTTIQNLPFELLSAIFIRYARLHRSGHPNPYEWLRITHVCKFWREIALNIPSLWNHIVILRLECVEAFIERSRFHENQRSNIIQGADELEANSDDAPLSIQLNGSFESGSLNRQELTFNALKAELHRIHELELRGPLFQADSFIQHFKHSTHLRRLILRGFSMSWKDAVFAPNLRHLSLIRSTDIVATSASFVGMLNALENLRELETLSITESTPYLSSFGEGLKRCIYLPNLKLLHVCEDSEDLTHLLDHISFPSTTKIDIFCIYSKLSDSVHLMNSLAARLKDTNHPPLLSLYAMEHRFKDQQPKDYEFRAWSQVLDPKDLRRGTYIEDEGEDDLWMYVDSDSLPDLSVVFVHVLVDKGRHFMEMTHGLDTSSISTLKVTAESYSKFTDYLLEVQKTSTSTSTNNAKHYFYPALKDVIFESFSGFDNTELDAYKKKLEELNVIQES